MEAQAAEYGKKIAAIDQELVQIKAQLTKAKTPAQQNTLKQKALTLLNRKKMYQKQVDMISGSAFNLENISMTMDSMKIAKETMATTTAALTTMQKEFKSVDVIKMETLADDMADLMADTNEINELLARPYDTYDAMDESELDAQLAGLEDELAASEPLETTAAPAAADTTSISAGAEINTAPTYVPSLPAPGSTPLPASSASTATPARIAAPVTFK